MKGAQPTRGRLAVAAAGLALLGAASAAAGISVPATQGVQAAVDEPQYLLSAVSLIEDGNLDISDELADRRARAYHPEPLPVQTEVRDDGSQVSPHDPLLPLLLAPAVGVGGWVAAKALLAALAGALAAATLWVGVRRFGAPLGITSVVVAAGFTSAPTAVYGQQVYPELPAALAVLAGVAALTGRLRWAGCAGLVLAVVALPWLSIKYAPIAAVLAATGLVLLWRGGRRPAAAVVAGTFAVACAAFLVVHRLVYGGWTAYASGDHFQASGEVGALGLAPDYLGRSTRLVGLLMDRDFGLVAWQPAWLLVVPAVGALPWLRPRRWLLLAGPLLAGWFVATFVALTMHGYWWPGRQLVVVLPLGLLCVAGFVGQLRGPARRVTVTAGLALAGCGTATYGWVLASGWADRLTWVGAPDVAMPGPIAAARSALPDYRELSATTWVLHTGWAVALAALLVLGALAARPPRHGPDRDSDHDEETIHAHAHHPPAHDPPAHHPPARDLVDAGLLPRRSVGLLRRRGRGAEPHSGVRDEQRVRHRQRERQRLGDGGDDQLERGERLERLDRFGVRERGDHQPVSDRAVRFRRLAAGAMVVALAATGCTPTGDDEVVRVYSARHYDLERAFEEFSADTGIAVEFLYGDDAALRERIEAEGEDTLADVYMSVDAGNLALAADEGIFAPVQSGTLDEAVPANLRDPEGRWYGLAARARTIVYDPASVDPSELSTYEALADPAWDGRLCLRGATETYTQSLVAAMIARLGYGEAKQVVQGWVDNAEIFSNDVDLLENIASGECDVGIANHYYLAQLLEADPDFPVEIFWANQQTSGTHVNVSGAGVTAEADDPDLARRLLEWLATDGQQAFTAGNFEYPVNPDAAPVPIVEAFGEFEADRLQAAELGTHNAEAIRLMAETGYE